MQTENILQKNNPGLNILFNVAMMAQQGFFSKTLKKESVDAMSDSSNATILLVDDDVFVLDMYALRLEQQGYDVSKFLSAKEALGFLRSGKNPNLILLDINMPNMDGFEFIEQVKKEGLAKNSIKVILSNLSDQVDFKRGKELGVSDYIVKVNVTPRDVANKVDSILSKNN